jgi:translation initiation factor IF-3
MKKSRYKAKPKQIKKPPMNERIRADKIRLIGDDGEQMGLMDLSEGIRIAKERGADLIQVTEKVDPPVCKIMDRGKFLYTLKKREQKAKHHHVGELKGVRLTFGISEHDLETRAKQAEKFLKKGDKIRIEMKLRGREKAHQDFAAEKVNKFVEHINQTIPVKIEKDLKKQPRGLIMIIGKK